jgi:hypothetical protein
LDSRAAKKRLEVLKITTAAETSVPDQEEPKSQKRQGISLFHRIGISFPNKK